MEDVHKQGGASCARCQRGLLQCVVVGPLSDHDALYLRLNSVNFQFSALARASEMYRHAGWQQASLSQLDDNTS